MYLINLKLWCQFDILPNRQESGLISQFRCIYSRIHDYICGQTDQEIHIEFLEKKRKKKKKRRRAWKLQVARHPSLPPSAGVVRPPVDTDLTSRLRRGGSRDYSAIRRECQRRGTARHGTGHDAAWLSGEGGGGTRQSYVRWADDRPRRRRR